MLLNQANKTFFVALAASLLFSPLCLGNTGPSNLEDFRKSVRHSIENLRINWVKTGGIEVVSAGPSSAKAQSRWGHLALRFVGSGSTPLDDIVVEALAVGAPEDGPVKIAGKGVFGGYLIGLSFGPLGNLIKDYYFRETRGYSRTILPSSERLRSSLLTTLAKINEVRFGSDRYYFFTENCASYLSWVLESSGFRQLPIPIPFIPTSAKLHFRNSFLAPWPEILSLPPKDLGAFHPENVTHWSSFSTLQLQRLLVFHGFELGSYMKDVVSELARRSDQQSTERVYGIEILPSAFYQQNQNLDASTLKPFFSKSQVTETLRLNRIAWSSAYTEAFCRASAECRFFEAAQKVLEGY